MPTDVLSGEKPTMAASLAADLVHTHWGIAVDDVAPLNAERDLNFYMRGTDVEFVFKCANAAESFETTLLQTQALLHLATTDLTVQVPRVLLTVQGKTEIIFKGKTVRLLSWVAGQPWHETAPSAKQRSTIAEAHGKMVLALADFHTTCPPPYLQWDVQNAAALQQKFDHLPPDLKGTVTQALARFEIEVAPLLANLPRQWGHNDIQPHNVVMRPNDPDQFAGFLDFGDMVYTPVACDLAVASAYCVTSGAHAFESVGQYVVAFHRLRPLSDIELATLPALIMARLCTTLVITSWRAALYPENSAYILRNQPMARKGLLQLINISHSDAIVYLRNQINEC
jgi:hydroxylysine kinase